MLVVISPAKRMNEGAGEGPDLQTLPRFATEAAELATVARGLDAAALQQLMHLSPALAQLNAGRFAAFAADPAPGQAQAAVTLFAGDTYAGLEARTLDADAQHWAQGRLRILSGLYGLLRPYDAIQPHRLEMGTRLQNAQGPTLYAFWGSRIAQALNADATTVGAAVLVNCASVEYFSAVDRAALRPEVVTPVFMEDREAGPKVISFHAKKARGAMARFIVENRIESPRALAEFDAGGYVYQPAMSIPDRPVFLR